MAITVPTPGALVQASWGADVTNAINTSLLAQSFIPYAYPLGSVFSATASSNISLAAVSSGLAGAILVPFPINGPMVIQSVTIRNGDTASARAAEFRLYRDSGDSTLDFITGTNGTFSFTPTVASDRTANVSTPGTIIQPGIIWLCLRNTSASQTFASSYTAAGTEAVGNVSAYIQTATVPALGTTLDISLFSSKTASSWVARLNGRFAGGTSAF